MQPLPIPCPAGLIPDATDPDTFNAAYRAAQEQQAVFIAVEHHGPRWTVKAVGVRCSSWWTRCCPRRVR